MITLKDICFAYEDRPVLKHIDLQVEAGETVMLRRPERLWEINADPYLKRACVCGSWNL